MIILAGIVAGLPAGIAGTAELVRNGDVKPAELLDAALARTDEVNGKLNAVVIDMREEARRVADAGVPDGPFAGVPRPRDRLPICPMSARSFSCSVAG